VADAYKSFIAEKETQNLRDRSLEPPDFRPYFRLVRVAHALHVHIYQNCAKLLIEFIEVPGVEQTNMNELIIKA